MKLGFCKQYVTHVAQCLIDAKKPTLYLLSRII